MTFRSLTYREGSTFFAVVGLGLLLFGYWFPALGLASAAIGTHLIAREFGNRQAVTLTKCTEVH